MPSDNYAGTWHYVNITKLDHGKRIFYFPSTFAHKILENVCTTSYTYGMALVT